jgi:hypothetical protein
MAAISHYAIRINILRSASAINRGFWVKKEAREPLLLFPGGETGVPLSNGY